MRRLLRVRDERGRTFHAERVGADGVVPLDGLGGRPAGPERPLAGLRLLAPCAPSKVVGIASNYRDHAAEMGRPVPARPRVFVVPPSAVVGPGDPVVRPAGCARLDPEAELGVVIGRRARGVRVEEAMDVVLGVCCANDVTARDWQRADGIFGRAKGADSFMPLGPEIVVGLDPSDLAVRCRVDGAVRQDGRTRDMVFSVPELVAFVSAFMTLEPGDVLATGTPAGVAPVEPGQLVEVEVEGVGVLANPVVAEG